MKFSAFVIAGGLLTVSSLIPSAGAAAVRSQTSGVQSTHAYHPWLKPPREVDPVAGCNFNGDCYTVRPGGIEIKRHGQALYVFRVPAGAAGAWRLLTAMSPVNEGGAIGMVLILDSSQARISMYDCPKSARCAMKTYGSARAYYRSAVRRERKQDHRRANTDQELAETYSPLSRGQWKGRRAYEFSYAYGGRIRSKNQRDFPDRVRRDVVLIPVSKGLFVATYTVLEKKFPAGMGAFREVIDSLKLWHTAPPVAARARSVPFFPGLTRAGSDRATDAKSEMHP